MKNNEAGMTLIVKTITRLTVGSILIYGIYIVLRGHLSPGGGFAGGVIIALSFILLMLAFGKDAALKKLDEQSCLFLGSLGALAFLVIATLNFLGLHQLLASKEHFKIFSASLIPLCDIAIAVLVGAGIFAIFLSLVLLIGRPQEK
jgi:multicomponent Na+:H+ antiporter subunit B